jgi:hypothetical protein
MKDIIQVCEPALVIQINENLKIRNKQLQEGIINDRVADANKVRRRTCQFRIKS